MAGRVEARLKELGLDLPQAAPAAGNYVPYVVTGPLIFVAGQLPVWNGTPRHLGHLGDTQTIEQGYQAARLCALNLIAQVKAACGGDLDRVRRIVRLAGFVACTAEFRDHPKVINGASDLMVEIFGDQGRHARAAVGAASLPLGVTVEVEAVVEM